MSPFLADPALDPLWAAVRAALDRNGLAWRGRLTLPELAPEGRRRLGVLIERPVPPGRRTVSLAELAAAVERVARTDLVGALDAVGHAPAGRREAAHARQEASRARRAALDAAVTDLGEQWAPVWADGAWGDGLFAGRAPAEVTELVDRVGQVLRLGGSGRSRTEIAALVLGDSHGLDSSTRLGGLITRALVARDGAAGERAAWERAGIPLDLVSAPVLTWGLPLLGGAGVALAVRAMTAAGLPLHLSVAALRAAAPLRVAAGTAVLVVENPRLVEAAAQHHLPAAVLCTNGNPTTAPSEAVAALGAAGAVLRYHGDFDAPGLAMAARAHAAGCVPFRMTAGDYREAVEAAAAAGVDLPREQAAPPPTLWDTALAVAFAESGGLVVHEERVMDDVLADHAAAGQAR